MNSIPGMLIYHNDTDYRNSIVCVAVKGHLRSVCKLCNHDNYKSKAWIGFTFGMLIDLIECNSPIIAKEIKGHSSANTKSENFVNTKIPKAKLG